MKMKKRRRTTKEETFDRIIKQVYELGMSDAELSSNFWHTGEPTEKGEYLLIEKESGCLRIGVLRDKEIEDCQGRPYQYTTWHKIPDYKEEEEE